MFTAKEFKSRVKSSQENAIKAMEQFIDDSLKTAVDNGIAVPYIKAHTALLDDLVGKYVNQGGYSVSIIGCSTTGENAKNTHCFNLKETVNER